MGRKGANNFACVKSNQILSIYNVGYLNYDKDKQIKPSPFQPISHATIQRFNVKPQWKICHASFRDITRPVVYQMHPHSINSGVCYCSFTAIIPKQRGLRSALLILLSSHKAGTLRSVRVPFRGRRMTSNSPRASSGGKLKLLWKGHRSKEAVR